MGSYKSEFLAVLEQRGFIHQCTDAAALDMALCAGPVTGYAGFDATADSLHVGHLIPIMMLYWMQQTGHRPIALMGGGTTKVGDPTGKDEARKMLSDAEIAANIASIRKTFDRFLEFGPDKAVLVDNADWLDGLAYIPFLRDVGRHFSVNRMLTMDSVKLRLEREQPMSFLEFNYMILQGYDFVELNRRHGCTLQIGGSDQWGNIVQGVDLGRRLVSANLIGLTNPLLTTSTGKKMGKTESGAVWLSAHRLSAYDYYQYWRNVDDADVGKLLRLFTLLPMDEIARLEALKGAGINEAKKVLAHEVTRLLHGGDAADDAAATAWKQFEQGTVALEAGVSVVPVGTPWADVFLQAGLVASKGEFRRKVAEGAITVRGQKVEDPALLTSDADIGPVFEIAFGKKKKANIEVTAA